MSHGKFSRRDFLKSVALGSLGAASIQVLSACTTVAPPADTAPSSAAEKEQPTTAPAAEPVVLRIQAPAGNLALTPQHFAEQFTEETGVEVVVEETIYGEIETKTQTGFIAGTLQDLLYGHHRWIFINFVKGIYTETDDLWAGSPPDDPDDFYGCRITG